MKCSKSVLLTSAFSIFALSLLIFTSSIIYTDTLKPFHKDIVRHNEQFQSFISTYSKDYKTTEEYEMRRQIFIANLKFIEVEMSQVQDQGDRSEVLGVNLMSDWTEAEIQQVMQKTHGGNEDEQEIFEDMLVQIHQETKKFDPEIDFNSRSTQSQEVNKDHPFVQALLKRPYQQNNLGLLERYNKDKKIKESIDWRDYPNVVSPPKEQGSCGSCWAFAAAAILEGSHAIQTGKSFQMSEQQIMDCVTEQDTGWYKFGKNKNPCDGGFMRDALEYFQHNYLASRKSYPYKGRGKKCKQKLQEIIPDQHKIKNLRNIVKVKKSKKIDLSALDKFKDQIVVDEFMHVNGYDPQALKEALNYGPVGVILNADSRSFLFYFRGIINTKNCKPKLNHAVVVVGYGADERSGQEYFIIKNSWGKWWGEGGYARISAGQDIYFHGMCGILRTPYIAFTKQVDASDTINELKNELKQWYETIE